MEAARPTAAHLKQKRKPSRLEAALVEPATSARPPLERRQSMPAALPTAAKTPPPPPEPPRPAKSSFARTASPLDSPPARLRRSKSSAREPNRRRRSGSEAEMTVASTARSSVSSAGGGGGGAGRPGNPVHPSAKVEAELKRIRHGWEAAEHRSIELKVGLLQTQVEAKTLRASLQAVEMERQTAQQDADELRRRVEELRANAAAAQGAAVSAREAQAAAEARRDELGMKMRILEAERDRAVSEAAQAKREAELVRGETEGLLGKLQLAGVQRAETHAQALVKWEAELTRFLAAGAASRLELVLVEGNARIFQEMRELLERQRATCAAEVGELRAWQLTADGRFREALQERQAALHRQLVEVGSLREGLLSEVRAAARRELEGKLTEARAEAHMLTRLLGEAAEKAAKREEAVAAQMAEHRAALAWATGELAHEAEALRQGASKLVAAESVAVDALQKQEQLREKTAKRVLLQLHRGTLAQCFRAWRQETSRAVGRNFSAAGAQAGLAALRRRGADAGGGGGGGASDVSEYLQQTLVAMEEEWAEREREGQLIRQQQADELRRVRDEMRRGQQQHSEARQALSEQTQLLATEAAEAQRDAARAQAEARAAREELAAARSGALDDASGASAQGVRLRLQLGEAEERARALQGEVEAARAAHAAALAEWRAELRGSEMRRLAQHEAGLARERRQHDAAHGAAEAQQQLLDEARAAHAEARNEAEALRAELAAAEERRRGEAAANARWVLELQGQLLRQAARRGGPAADSTRAYGGV